MIITFCVHHKQIFHSNTLFIELQMWILLRGVHTQCQMHIWSNIRCNKQWSNSHWAAISSISSGLPWSEWVRKLWRWVCRTEVRFVLSMMLECAYLTFMYKKNQHEGLHLSVDTCILAFLFTQPSSQSVYNSCDNAERLW